MVADHSTPEIPLKTCTKCGERKPETEFSRKKQCKSCTKAYYQAYEKANAAHRSAYRKDYYAKHRQRIRVKQQAYGRLNRVKILAQKQAYNDAHRDDKNAYMKAYLLIHRERINANRRAAQPRYREKSRLYHRVWRSPHPEKKIANEQRRRANKRQAPRNDLTAAQWREIKAHYGSRCVYCGRRMQRLTMDHIIPLSRGGDHTASNIVPACSRCNSHKYVGPPLKPVQPLLLTIAPPKKKHQ